MFTEDFEIFKTSMDSVTFVFNKFILVIFVYLDFILLIILQCGWSKVMK